MKKQTKLLSKLNIAVLMVQDNPSQQVPWADYIAGQSSKMKKKKGALQHVNGYPTGSDLPLGPSYLLNRQ